SGESDGRLRALMRPTTAWQRLAATCRTSRMEQSRERGSSRPAMAPVGFQRFSLNISVCAEIEQHLRHDARATPQHASGQFKERDDRRSKSTDDLFTGDSFVIPCNCRSGLSGASGINSKVM